jgi:capsular polysaccharide export protein
MKQRHFLFLQGPHGPFFRQLAAKLRQSGAQVWRVGFNAGDAAFWRPKSCYIPYRDDLADWPRACADLMVTHQITDLVVYGDARSHHASAIATAKTMGLRVHVFEEGYLRPYWVTYERDGSNGYSPLMQISVAQMQAALAQDAGYVPTPPAHWGDMRQHIFYGAAYHWFVLMRNRRYPHYRPHRDLPVLTEARLYSQRLLLMPFMAVGRALATARIKSRGAPYHVALLQLEHDASVQTHSAFTRMEEFIDLVIKEFATGAPAGHHLVFKAHPLENGRSNLRAHIAKSARMTGLAGRVHYLRGGKLAHILDSTQSAVTINSTAAQQALWRGIPLRIFGAAIYDKPEFVSDQPLAAFFARPRSPDLNAYRDFRQFLLETCQIAGGYYAAKGRRQLLAQVPAKMLAETDLYRARH